MSGIGSSTIIYLCISLVAPGMLGDYVTLDGGLPLNICINKLLLQELNRDHLRLQNYIHQRGHFDRFSGRG